MQTFSRSHGLNERNTVGFNSRQNGMGVAGGHQQNGMGAASVGGIGTGGFGHPNGIAVATYAHPSGMMTGGATIRDSGAAAGEFR